MALFSKTSKKTKAPAAKAAVSMKVLEDSRLENVLRAPWLSEKALIGTEKGVYVFAIPAEATKTDVSNAIERIYKVAPRAVRVVNLPAKRKNLRHKRGMGSRSVRRKAYVYLKKGETITFA